MDTVWNNLFKSTIAVNPHLSSHTDEIYQKYYRSFTENYMSNHDMQRIIEDIIHLESIHADDHIAIDLYETRNQECFETKIVIYKKNKSIILSEILPVLENFGFKTLHEETYHLNTEKDHVYVHEFSVQFYQNSKYKLADIKPKLTAALKEVLYNNDENDGFNRLVATANMDVNTVNIIRSYAKYMKQVKYRYSQSYIEKTVVNNVEITEQLVQYFYALHNPKSYFNAEPDKIIAEIDKQLEQVSNIDDDNIIRRLQLLIKATVRTNYFQKDAQGKNKEYITLKIRSNDIPDMPLPKPLIDTFVYSPHFEGIHLRSNKVSRGGIRWSDRHEDYRTEVLGLMKAQKVKNSIIIPSGAKGGFVIKEKALREYGDMKECIIKCYQQFIRGLLDVTDNIVNQDIVHPQDTICHDGQDAYFVVAADKGTADLSDYANSISNEYAFWLGDAFASGGSNGYDHKKIGITAKGAFESLKRNLQEIHLENSEYTMAGIGDMSGDVFGNGLIISNKVKLIAAFDHRHIFIDPDPNPDTSYHERLRLFHLKSSSWNDYNKELLSKGGGVYKRSDKLIQLSPEAQKALGTEESKVSPDQLIRIILKSPVDVLYNGGIGTYVKSSKETSENIGDKYNEFCRVNGNELRCKIVCEGGNLGFTQLARVEFALNGGLINTDFIDNSAGVDCSDHEVNIKVLLINALRKAKLNETTRSTLLSSMQDEVSRLVLNDNYSQALLMSYSSFHAKSYFDLYHDQIRWLEEYADLNRDIEFLPSEEEISNRKASGKSLTKPELAVLLAYTKIHVKNEILSSSLTDNTFFNSYLTSYFPSVLSEKFKDEICDHRLRKEIISTQISNEMLNNMGITFPFRLMNETGATIAEVAAAYALSMKVFDAEAMYQQVQSLDNKISIEFQYDLLHNIRSLLNMSSRWFLQRRRVHHNLHEIHDFYHQSIQQLLTIIPGLIRGNTKEYVNHIGEECKKYGIDAEQIGTIAMARVLYTALNISDVASIHNFDLVKSANLYFEVGAIFNLVWFRDYLAKDNIAGSRSNRAKLAIRDDIDALQRRLTINIMQSDTVENNIEKLTANWIEDNKSIMNRWNHIFNDFTDITPGDYASLFIAIREFTAMVDTPVRAEKMSLLAYHDALTKLPNRLAISDKLENMRNKADREHTSFAIHFIDLNKFKEVNDKYGHHVGDEVLIEVTKRLISSIRSGDVAARQSGDEFVVLQSGVYKEPDAVHLAKCIMAIISKPMYIGEHRIVISASVGTAIYPLHGTKPLELLNKADKAMYKAKSETSHPATPESDKEVSQA